MRCALWAVFLPALLRWWLAYVVGIKKAPLRELLLCILAERVGFEPTVRFNVRLISSQVHSTTLPPLRLLRSIHSNWRAGLNEALF